MEKESDRDKKTRRKEKLREGWVRVKEGEKITGWEEKEERQNVCERKEAEDRENSA